MIHFQLNAKRLFDSEYGAYTSYGVTVFEGNTAIYTVEDISLDRDRVKALISVCNAGKLSLVHLDDVIESFLYDFEV